MAEQLIFSEKGYKIFKTDGRFFIQLPGKSASSVDSGLRKNGFDTLDEARTVLTDQMKKDGVYGVGSFGNAFSNGRVRAMNAIAEKLGGRYGNDFGSTMRDTNWREGKRAKSDGEKKEACPYPKDSTAGSCWLAGYEGRPCPV
jgi:ribosome modulation factor